MTDDVTRVDFSERPFGVWVGDDEYRADSVIVATGAPNDRPVGIPGDDLPGVIGSAKATAGLMLEGALA